MHVSDMHFKISTQSHKMNDPCGKLQDLQQQQTQQTKLAKVRE
jgi:hypothetical protein